MKNQTIKKLSLIHILKLINIKDKQKVPKFTYSNAAHSFNTFTLVPHFFNTPTSPPINTKLTRQKLHAVASNSNTSKHLVKHTQPTPPPSHITSKQLKKATNFVLKPPPWIHNCWKKTQWQEPMLPFPLNPQFIPTRHSMKLSPVLSRGGGKKGDALRDEGTGQAATSFAKLSETESENGSSCPCSCSNSILDSQFVACGLPTSEPLRGQTYTLGYCVAVPPLGMASLDVRWSTV